jgi:hypothetical protein
MNDIHIRSAPFPRWQQGIVWLSFAALLLLQGGCASGPSVERQNCPRYELKAEETWLLNLPHGERFDASGLLLQPDGHLLTVNDRGPQLYEIRFNPGTNTAELIPSNGCFLDYQLAPFAREKHGHYDTEGIARDAQGRIYICEEADRWILRWDPKTGAVERLPIDWTRVSQYFSPDLNASFEGVAVGGGKLYVANEREHGRILVVDLKTLRIVDDFVARPKGNSTRDVHYSDLCFYDGALYALLRESKVVLKIDPKSHGVIAEYDYFSVERKEAYLSWLAYGSMEGLAVDRDSIWLVTDNNGLGKLGNFREKRPTLFKCPRPD